MIGIALSFVVFFCILALVLSWQDDEVYADISKVCFVLHALIAIVALPILFEAGHRWDVYGFHATALEIYAGDTISGSIQIRSFAIVMAILYAIFTPDLAIPSIFNGLVAVLIPIPAAILARNLYSDLQLTTGLKGIILFLPTSLFFLTLPMRDAITVFLFFAVLALLASGIRSWQFWPLLVAFPLIALISLPRRELAVIVLVGLIAAIGLSTFERVSGAPSSLRSVMVMGTTSGLLAFLAFVELFFSLERANRLMQTRARGGATYLSEMTLHSWFDFILVAPTRAIYFQFAPFPLHVRGLVDLFVVLSLPLLIVFALAAYRCMRRETMNPAVGMLVVVVYFTGIVGYGMINSNFGTTIRHRIPFVYLLVVFAAPAVETVELSVRRRFENPPRDDPGDQR